MSNGKFKRFIIPKVLLTLSLLAITALMVVMLVDVIQQVNSGNGWAGLGYAILIVYGGIALAVCLLLSLICLIVAKVKKNKGLASGGTVAYFALLTVLPVIIYVVILLLTKLIS